MNLWNKFVGLSFTKQALTYMIVLILDSLIIVASGVFTIIGNSWLSVGQDIAQLIGTLCFYLVFYIIGFLIMRMPKGVIRFSAFVDLFCVVITNFIALVLIFSMRNYINKNKNYV